MKLLNVTIASIVLSSLCYGCAEVEPGPGARTLPGLAGVQVSGHGHAPQCDWSFDTDSDGRLARGSLKVDPQNNPGHCTVVETNVLFISGSLNPHDFKKVLSKLPAIEFVTEGSTRYCYVNSDGGMSCIIFP
jgi:hypothetical protein